MENSWITYNISPKWEEQARAIREKRDRMYSNIFEEEDTDLRWVGDLGEICFNYWLKESGLTGYGWHLDNAVGKPDFTINDIRIDVKTVKRKVAPRTDYTGQITARHKDHPIDELFFASYEFQIKKMWLLGGIKLPEFIKHAKYYSAGDFVHSKYQIRSGHEIYNGEYALLDTPKAWLKRVTQ